MKFLTTDFGSTFTKLTAIDSRTERIVGTSCAFTTIETDIAEGFHNALAKLEAKIGRWDYDKLLCSSSAGGGLKMVALGLVPELTAKAAKMAASSAGAKVVKTYSFEISKSEQHEIYEINPDVVLLCGGTDGGNKDVIVANARRLCAIEREFTIIAAGNKSASYELEEIFAESGKDYIITDNVMPTFNALNIAPAKESIRSVFIRRIIDAKGLTGIQRMADADIVPTPLAVMSACELLSKGTKGEAGIGEFMAVDLGGATTDIYSMSHGKPVMDNVLVKGLPEPFSKRTVEGDLGMRYSLGSLIDESDMDRLVQWSGADEEQILSWAGRCTDCPDTLADSDESPEMRIEEALARSAVAIALERHCGVMESAYTPLGEIYSVTGKDLTGIDYIIGIGGAIINSLHPERILAGANYDTAKPNSLKPKSLAYMVDTKYIMAAMGLLSGTDADLALRIMKCEIKRL